MTGRPGLDPAAEQAEALGGGKTICESNAAQMRPILPTG